MTDVRIVQDADVGGALVAAHLASAIAVQPRYVLGVATGASPLSVYRALSTHVADGLDVTQLRCFALDEYVGLAPDHPQRCESVLLRELAGPLNLKADQISVPETEDRCLATTGDHYERLLEEAGGVDLQLLGIGRNGHIGFNEPSSSLASLTRVKMLASETRADNARFFGSHERVPTQGVTQGVGTICRARHVVLLAFGYPKADAIAAAIEGPVTSIIPASAVQLHPHATVVIDEAAASKLRYRKYYLDVQRTNRTGVHGYVRPEDATDVRCEQAVNGKSTSAEYRFSESVRNDLKMPPSEYWKRQCYLGASFMGPTRSSLPNWDRQDHVGI